MQQEHRWQPRRRPADYTSPVRVDPDGVTGPTRGRAAGPGWRRTSLGYYVPAHVDPNPPTQRIAEAVPLLPSGGSVTGWGSLHLAHAGFLDGRRLSRVLPVRLLVGPHAGRHHRPGIQFLEDRLDDVVWRHGVPCAPLPRSLFDEMRASDLREAVVALDMTAAAEVLSVCAFQEYVDGMAGWTGVPLVRAAIDLADEASRSPQETRLRLIWVFDAGLPPPLVNPPVFDMDGNLLGYPDLLDVEAGHAVEYDGEDHRPALRQSSDVGREQGFRRHRIEVTRVTGPDMSSRAKVVGRLLAGRALARFEAPSQRTWTLTPPPWWRPPPTVDEAIRRRTRLAGPEYCCAAGSGAGNPAVRQ
jgi:hypothetical protein